MKLSTSINLSSVLLIVAGCLASNQACMYLAVSILAFALIYQLWSAIRDGRTRTDIILIGIDVLVILFSITCACVLRSNRSGAIALAVGLVDYNWNIRLAGERA